MLREHNEFMSEPHVAQAGQRESHTDGYIDVRDDMLKDYLAQLPEHPTVQDYDALIERLEKEKKAIGESEADREERVILGSIIVRIKRERYDLEHSRGKM